MKESPKPAISDEEILEIRLRDRANNPPVIPPKTINELRGSVVFGDMEERAAKLKELLSQ